MRTIVITGSASGMGAATANRLRQAGDRVIGVDLRDADIVGDLGTTGGRRDAIDGVRQIAGDAIDGLVTFAGIGGFRGRQGSQVVAINYFGTVELLAGLRPALAGGTAAAAVAISSNSTTCQPGVPADLVAACLEGDEEQAKALGDKVGSNLAYPATKMAIARWVRQHAVAAEWAGAGITLNAIAPGKIDTPLVAEGYSDPELAPLLDQFPLPVGRAGRPDEIAALAQFLLGPDARFFCGSVLFCDGGTEALLRPADWPVSW
jgi:NAD(P)-dependent dehydrogenase (short-subunit alcohol dehydrogenase family)